jgi:glycosyltransferase involved in cell wall biosynthesis
MDVPRYSVIVPVYNRPEEVRDLLESLSSQTRRDFEVIVVEDGSTVTSEDVVREYSSRLDIRYFSKPNSGPGPSRNFGFAHARGDYFVLFDSDCILPPDYFESVEQALTIGPLDAWGGPDRGHAASTLRQRAMAYTMSSFLTTGGIRGGKKTSYRPLRAASM